MTFNGTLTSAVSRARSAFEAYRCSLDPAYLDDVAEILDAALTASAGESLATLSAANEVLADICCEWSDHVSPIAFRNWQERAIRAYREALRLATLDVDQARRVLLSLSLVKSLRAVEKFDDAHETLERASKEYLAQQSKIISYRINIERKITEAHRHVTIHGDLLAFHVPNFEPPPEPTEEFGSEFYLNTLLEALWYIYQMNLSIPRAIQDIHHQRIADLIREQLYGEGSSKYLYALKVHEVLYRLIFDFDDISAEELSSLLQEMNGCEENLCLSRFKREFVSAQYGVFRLWALKVDYFGGNEFDLANAARHANRLRDLPIFMRMHAPDDVAERMDRLCRNMKLFKGLLSNSASEGGGSNDYNYSEIMDEFVEMLPAIIERRAGGDLTTKSDLLKLISNMRRPALDRVSYLRDKIQHARRQGNVKDRLKFEREMDMVEYTLNPLKQIKSGGPSAFRNLISQLRHSVELASNETHFIDKETGKFHPDLLFSYPASSGEPLKRFLYYKQLAANCDRFGDAEGRVKYQRQAIDDLRRALDVEGTSASRFMRTILNVELANLLLSVSTSENSLSDLRAAGEAISNAGETWSREYPPAICSDLLYIKAEIYSTYGWFGYDVELPEILELYDVIFQITQFEKSPNDWIRYRQRYCEVLVWYTVIKGKKLEIATITAFREYLYRLGAFFLANESPADRYRAIRMYSKLVDTNLVVCALASSDADYVYQHDAMRALRLRCALLENALDHSDAVLLKRARHRWESAAQSLEPDAWRQIEAAVRIGSNIEGDPQFDSERHEHVSKLFGELEAMYEELGVWTKNSLTQADLAPVVSNTKPIVCFAVSDLGSFATIVHEGDEGAVALQHIRLNGVSRPEIRELLLGEKGWFAKYDTFSKALNTSPSEQDAESAIDDLELSIGAVCEELGDKVLGPVVEALLKMGLWDQVQELRLVPNGYLASLPLHAALVPVSASKRVPLLFSKPVSYWPCLEAIVRNSQAENEARQPAGLVATEDAAFRDALRRSGCEREVRLSQHAALETNLKDAPVAFFQSHGRWRPETPIESGIELSDGVLTISDFRRMDIRDSNLIFLGTCDSGLIDLDDLPDEFVGLPAALIEAGTSCVISSLWVAHEDFVRELAGALSQKIIVQRKSAAQALRDAIIELSTDASDYDFSSPVFWAGFTVFGGYDPSRAGG